MSCEYLADPKFRTLLAKAFLILMINCLICPHHLPFYGSELKKKYQQALLIGAGFFPRLVGNYSILKV
jgi:hypothetical protein